MLLQKMLKSNKFTVNFNCEFKPVVNPRLKHKNSRRKRLIFV